jgi:Rab5 GDP/GTP exchange factor
LYFKIHPSHFFNAIDSTFTPQLIRSVPPRPITVDDLERDRVLSQRIVVFRWIEEKHLDVPEGEGSKGFLMFAQQGMYILLF